MAARVEVVVRLGDTVLDVVHLRPGGVFRIGSAPGVELPAAIATSFPIVEGTVVRRPAGVTAHLIAGNRRTALTDNALRLAIGQQFELAVGLATVAISRVELERAELPRPPSDRRPYAFGLVALLAHLALWAAAIAIAPFVPHAVARPLRNAHVRPTVVKTPVEPAVIAQSPPVAAPAGAVVARPRAHREAHAERSMTEGVAAAAQSLSDMTAIDNGFDPAAGVYHEGDEGGFGTGRWDLENNPRFASIASGRYATVAEGRAAGAFYDPFAPPATPSVVLCATGGCRVSGGTDERSVRSELEHRLDAILACYRDHAPARIAGEVVLEFEIADDGSVRGAHGRGLGSVGPCVAQIVSEIAFPSASRATRARYPMTFRPA